MTLSIIIVNFKSRELLKLCLQSLVRGIPAGLSTETLVIDSQAEEETGEMVRENFPAVRYWPQTENIGYARGVNFGLRQAQGDFYLILNPDIVITAKAIAIMLDFMQQHPVIGLLGPQLLNFGGQVQNSRFRFYRPATIIYRRTFFGRMPSGKKRLEDFNLQDQPYRQETFPDWLMGSALLTTKTAVQKVGLLDERFFLYFEDVDWAKRFWENGYKVCYYPKAVMYHYHQRRSQAGLGMLDFFLRREARWHLQSALKYFLKHSIKYRSGVELYGQYKLKT